MLHAYSLLIFFLNKEHIVCFLQLQLAQHWKSVNEGGKSLANFTLFLWVQNSLKHLLQLSAYLFYK